MSPAFNIRLTVVNQGRRIVAQKRCDSACAADEDHLSRNRELYDDGVRRPRSPGTDPGVYERQPEQYEEFRLVAEPDLRGKRQHWEHNEAIL